MKNRIVLYVFIYFELVASYPSSEADQLPKSQNVQPAFGYQKGFNPESVKPYFDNKQAYRSSDTSLGTGSALKPLTQKGQNNENYLLSYQPKNPLVEQTVQDQQRLYNIYLKNQAKLQNIPQTQNQYAAVPILNAVRHSYMNPVQRQYQPVNMVKNIEKPASFRRQTYQNDRNLPLINVPLSPEPSDIQKLQNDSVNIKEVERNVQGQGPPSQLEISRLAGNIIAKHLLNNPKLREVVATTKPKKRYMVIHPNGEVEHVDSKEDILAKYPSYLFVQEADVKRVTDALSNQSLSLLNIPQSPTIPLKSNQPLSPVLPPLFPSRLTSTNIQKSPALPLQTNKPSYPGRLPPTYSPQSTSLNLLGPVVVPFKLNTQSSALLPLRNLPQVASSNLLAMPLKSNEPLSSVVLTSTSQPQPTSSNLSTSPTVPLKTNASSPPVVLSPTHHIQSSSSNIFVPLTTPLRHFAPLSSVVQPSIFPSQSTSSNISQSLTFPVKSNAQSSPVGLPPHLTNTLASTPKVSSTPVSQPLSPTIPVLLNSTTESKTSKSILTPIKPYVSQNQKLTNDEPSPQSLSSSPIFSYNKENEASPVQNSEDPKIHSRQPISSVYIKTIPNTTLSTPQKTPMIMDLDNFISQAQAQNLSDISNINNKNNTKDHLSETQSKGIETTNTIVLHATPSSYEEPKMNSIAVKINTAPGPLPLTITEMNPKLETNKNSSSNSVSTSHLNTVSDLLKNSTSKDKENDVSNTKTVQKPIAMVSPTPEVFSAPIELADLFPIIQEDNVSKPTLNHNKTIDYINSPTRNSSFKNYNFYKEDNSKLAGDSNIVNHIQSDTTLTTSNDDKPNSTDIAANVNFRSVAQKEKDLKVINPKSTLSPNNYVQTTEAPSKPNEWTDSSAYQTASQVIVDEDAQNVHNNGRAISDSPSSTEKSANTVAETTKSINPSTVVDTTYTSSFSTSPDESLEKSFSIVTTYGRNGNEDAETTESKIPSTVVSTTSATSFSTSLDESSEKSFSIVTTDEGNGNEDAETMDSKIPSTVVDATSAISFATSSDESSEKPFSIVTTDGKNGNEDFIDLLQGKKNLFWFTPPDDELWKKLLGDDSSPTMVYFLKMPSHESHDSSQPANQENEPEEQNL